MIQRNVRAVVLTLLISLTTRQVGMFIEHWFFFLAFSDILFISEWLPSNCLQLVSTLSDNSSVYYIARLGTAKNKFTRDGFAFPFLKSNRTNISVQEIKLESERILGIEINHETNYVW